MKILTRNILTKTILEVLKEVSTGATSLSGGKPTGWKSPKTKAKKTKFNVS